MAQDANQVCLPVLLRVLQRSAREVTNAALHLTISASSHKNAHDISVIVDDRQHERSEPILCGVIEVRASVDKEVNHRGIATVCRIHKCGLAVLVKRVNIRAGIQ
jgi:hypothetical protein